MLIFPAIDLRGGRVVRLSEGDYDRMTVYDADPVETARRFRAAGARCLHVVDLDGAKDGTQENLLNRLEDLIYETSMVANISDDDFGHSSSGTALAYKLQSMSNLAMSFDRKIEKSLRKRYKIFCSLSTNCSDPNAWRDVEIRTTRNIPRNVLEEAQTAAQLSGIVSKETQLSVLSVVQDPAGELVKMEKEKPIQQEMVGFDNGEADG